LSWNVIKYFQFFFKVSHSSNWHSRKSLAKRVGNLVSANLFMLIENKLLINELTKLIIRLLSDDRVEVRESAANTLSGLLHCELILITDKLIKEFEINANHKYTINGFKLIDPKLMQIKHSGILGLCACSNAYPYKVPYFTPDIIIFLTEHLNDPQPIPL
jgi:proteasome activator subunit 4